MIKKWFIIFKLMHFNTVGMARTPREQSAFLKDAVYTFLMLKQHIFIKRKEKVIYDYLK